MTYYNKAKNALNAISTKRKNSKVIKNYDYSKYWMGDYSNQYEKFSGLSQGMSTTSDLVKLIKLSNYRRAVSNFVKILTGKAIPVSFSGSDSYTTGDSINISTNINEKNFDVTVGLALHEASHVLLSDMKLLQKLFTRDEKTDSGGRDTYTLLESYIPQHKLGMFEIHMYNSDMPLSLSNIKSLWNWIEDRRIDNYVFTTSPGYKAYYHKLYDHYWHDKAITKGLLSSNMRTRDLDSYMFRIINMINPASDLTALPGLEEIYNIVDLKNISRLKSCTDALQVAIAVACLLDDYIAPVQHADDKTQPQQSEHDWDTRINVCDTGDQPKPLSDKEDRELQKAIEQQKKMLKGDIKKVSCSKRLQQKLEKFASDAYDIETVGPNLNTECIIIDLTKQQNTLAELETRVDEIVELDNKLHAMSGKDPSYIKLRQKRDELYDNLADTGYLGLDYTGSGHAFPIRNTPRATTEAITKGLEVGALLGKKIQIRSEVRERTDNRLKTGHIDNKRLAHAGYGIESIFKQISIDKYRKINLHLSLDQSGSMNGTKWEQTVTMAVAIAKSATMVSNIDVQLSTRCTSSSGKKEAPVTVIVYDSRKNKLHHLLRYFKMSAPNSMTPEGLCFDAMLKKRIIVPSKPDMDSYFINLSDGEPQCGDYYGRKAVEHTAAISKKIQALGVTLIGYFMTEKSNISDNASYNDFAHMYGSKNSRHINAYSAIEIAKTLNERFMEAKETV